MNNPRRTSLNLYAIPNCCLCEDAWQLIQELDAKILNTLSIKKQMIHRSPDLMKQYGWSVPVLYDEEREEILFWPFNEKKILHFLQKENS